MSYRDATNAVMHDLWKFVLAGFKYTSGERNLLDFSPITFEDGAYYGAYNKDTTTTRLLLTRQYSRIDALQPLQPSEYVAFSLQEQKIRVTEDAKHWLPGYWHKNLKGQANVHISVNPSQGAVIEYFDENQDGKIGIVKKLYEDDTIIFTSVGLYTDGVYEEHTVSKAVWHELRPVFVTFRGI
jgi:hypothetical protein